MRYWWVNQNQTFNQEFDGGYMWAPKLAAGGRSLQAYSNMTLVSRGDRVFSFKGQQIVALSRIQSTGYSAVKPDEFGNVGDYWSDEGWRVDVDYKLLHQPIRPAQHMNELRDLLPARHSPLQPSGRGNQAYLFAVDAGLANKLLELLGEESPTENGVDVESEIDHFLKSQLGVKLGFEEEQETEIDQLIKSRKGQGKFRSNLELVEQYCRVTGITNLKHLIASHIKPWSKSNNRERLDGNNGLLLSPHIDHLFDKGHISFLDDGQLLIGRSADSAALSAWGISQMNVGSFNDAQRGYLAYHRRYIFSGA